MIKIITTAKTGTDSPMIFFFSVVLSEELFELYAGAGVGVGVGVGVGAHSDSSTASYVWAASHHPFESTFIPTSWTFPQTLSYKEDYASAMKYNFEFIGKVITTSEDETGL